MLIHIRIEKIIKLGLPIFGILVILKFWVGLYADDEFNETHIFIKHRPIWKSYFYSPRGMSDLELYQMSKERQLEQILFDEFILKIKPHEIKQ